MILQPAVIALLGSSVITACLVLYAASFAISILRRWDLKSGSEIQINLEKSTYLVSTALAYVFGFQIVSFFLYIFTADQLCTLFVGAMCAAGTLHVNPLGYPTLLLKLVNAVLSGLWLILNHADTRAPDYPLVRSKYALVLGLAPLLVAEAALQAGYFLGLRADVITSCCGTLFSSEQGTVVSEIVAAPVGPAKAFFFGSTLLTLAVGARLAARGRGAYAFGLLSALHAAVCIVALISFLSPYYYELPTHHCPFCILKPEYGGVGYLLYGTLLVGVVCGLGTSILQPFRERESLREVVPCLQRSLAVGATSGYLGFTVVTALKMILSNYRA